eukprot:669511-Amphidinium_carterae.1
MPSLSMLARSCKMVGRQCYKEWSDGRWRPRSCISRYPKSNAEPSQTTFRAYMCEELTHTTQYHLTTITPSVFRQRLDTRSRLYSTHL